MYKKRPMMHKKRPMIYKKRPTIHKKRPMMPQKRDILYKQVFGICSYIDTQKESCNIPKNFVSFFVFLGFLCFDTGLFGYDICLFLYIVGLVPMLMCESILLAVVNTKLRSASCSR